MVALTMTLLLSLIVGIQAVLGTPVSSRSPYRVKETHHVPRKWTLRRRAPASHMINLQIGLKQGRFDELERHLYEVSDPDHYRYGQHLSAEEVYELVKPTDQALDLVHEWLQENGIENLNYSPSKDWIEVRVNVETVERLLKTKYYVFEHEDGSQFVRAPKWSLPRHLHQHVDTIQPTTSFFRFSPQKLGYVLNHGWGDPDFVTPSDPNLAKVCNISSVTPECFMELYCTGGYVPKATDVNQVAFNNFLGEIPIRPDTARFLAKYRPEAVSAAAAYQQISIADGPTQDGPLNSSQANAEISHEANLDVQTIIGISWPIPVTAFSTGGSPPFIPDLATPINTNEPYLTWVNYALSLPKIPQVISTSYGDDEQTVPQSYAERVCQSFAQLGARGVSLLFASGDNGVGTNQTCISNDGKNTTMFLPNFPASCPYVTTVGATRGFTPEVAAFRPAIRLRDGTVINAFGSGGGFSNYFPRPQYQNRHVEGYIKKLKGKFDGLYNKLGRAYPDLAAQGQDFATFWNGSEGVISGTSASAPLAAGIIAMVNDALISAGKPPLGFLNPWLYRTGHRGLNDILNGSAVGCGIAGFPAAKGWDAVTGFGTPDFSKLVDLAMGDH